MRLIDADELSASMVEDDPSHPFADDVMMGKGEPMSEQGTDRYGAEYKRTNNDFYVRYLEQDNGLCSVCHGTGAKIEIKYVVRNYESARVKKKICKNLQAHERSLWICPKCINNFKQKISVLEKVLNTTPTINIETVIQVTQEVKADA